MTNDEAFFYIEATVGLLRTGDQTFAAQTVAITMNALYLDKSEELWRDMDPIFAKWIAKAKAAIAEKQDSTTEWPDIFD